MVLTNLKKLKHLSSAMLMKRLTAMMELNVQSHPVPERKETREEGYTPPYADSVTCLYSNSDKCLR